MIRPTQNASKTRLKRTQKPTEAEFRTRSILFVNFGGPRTLREVPLFLTDLLSDQDVIQTPLPQWLHRQIFSKIARLRSLRVIEDYRKIGGGSPIYYDTEKLAHLIGSKLSRPVLSFHRYLRFTHHAFVEKISRQEEAITVFPFFPQFSYATTGSIARFFAKNLHPEVLERLEWIASYATHPAYIRAFALHLQKFLETHFIVEKGTLFLFSAHGLPQSYVDAGDPYLQECEASFHAIKAFFPEAKHLLCYQSQFGKEEWLRPYTKDVCEEIAQYKQTCHTVLLIPLSFTSDHIETLFEIEQEYMPLCQEAGFTTYRIPALGFSLEWQQAICTLIQEEKRVETATLIR